MTTSSAVRISNLDRTTSKGLSTSFRHGAQECLFGAEQLEKNGMSNLTPEYILTLHAIELGLKAFLAKQGLTAEQLRKKYGHDLVRLYGEAKKHGLSLSGNDIETTLAWVNEYHDKPLLRYEFAQTRELPICAELFPIVAELITASK